MRISAIIVGIVVSCGTLQAQTTQPAAPVPAQTMLNSLLQHNSSSGARPLLPTSQPAIDVTTGGSAVAPGATTQPVLREGTYMVDRMGRMTRTADGQNWELTLESDGKAMMDPPLIILPNQTLSVMENILKGSNRDLKWRITGMVTEYNGRNYILMTKASVPSDATLSF